ncbi:MAG: CIA30 family protein [Longimonas sp.]|uniref:CIA30 family protein n=1 Tax=Longimonas sp. TaxID=2039626 RepID=UPI003975F16A
MSRLLVLVIATTALIPTHGNNRPAPAEAIDTEIMGSEATDAGLTDGPVSPMSSSEPMVLFDFDGADTAQWSIENDGVMGGRSEGFVEVAGGTLVFTGEVVTEGGGFSSVRAALQTDISSYDGIELRVRGGGRTFELDVDDGTESRGREVNRRGPVPTSNSWETVRVPFASLEASAHGEPVRVDPLDRSAVKSIGVYIIDGQDGPFRLEVDWIRAYREAE